MTKAKVETVTAPEFPPVSVNDSWNAVAGAETAHLFPVNATLCLCGHFTAKSIRGRATCAGVLSPRQKKFIASGELFKLPYCGTCLALNDARWAKLSTRN